MLTCLMGFHHVAAEAASEYVVSLEKLKLEDNVDGSLFPIPIQRSISGIHFFIFFGKRV